MEHVYAWILLPPIGDGLELVMGKSLGTKDDNLDNFPELKDLLHSKPQNIREKILNRWNKKGLYTSFKLAYEKSLRQYNPLIIEPQLYKKFAEVDYNNTESILEFANKYGDLCPNFFVSSNIVREGTYIEDWRKHIKQIQNLVFIAEALDVQNPDDVDYVKLEKTIKPLGDGKYMLNLISSKLYITVNPVFITDKDTELFDVAKYFVIKQINEVLVENSFVKILFVTDTKEYKQYLYLKNLLAVLYYELYLDVFKQRPVKECEFCHSLFVPQKKGQKFCPESIKKYDEKTSKWVDIPTGKHCRQYAHKTEKRVVELYQKGYTVEEIHKQLTEKQKAYATLEKIQEIIKKQSSS
ncbi:hypothetical protein [Caldanaerobacter subterraneus]|jgi:hypothetical protein|uniref:Uncharacterized protein n=1 Tax=Caldanaerobacter subterraneus TaxID=911092 RepID=A0A4V2S6V5_9THEO|nr:hypothetical protein [Caldanaerobacter subterraneus]TCO57490.1 hypothetical protein EV203_13112 [Caldanaerobacter subterraneus]HAE61989.1 hypothetical protein [Eubacteriaceae bacterium]